MRKQSGCGAIAKDPLDLALPAAGYRRAIKTAMEVKPLPTQDLFMFHVKEGLPKQFLSSFTKFKKMLHTVKMAAEKCFTDLLQSTISHILLDPLPKFC